MIQRKKKERKENKIKRIVVQSDFELNSPFFFLIEDKRIEKLKRNAIPGETPIQNWGLPLSLIPQTPKTPGPMQVTMLKKQKKLRLIAARARAREEIKG